MPLGNIAHRDGWHYIYIYKI